MKFGIKDGQYDKLPQKKVLVVCYTDEPFTVNDGRVGLEMDTPYGLYVFSAPESEVYEFPAEWESE